MSRTGGFALVVVLVLAIAGAGQATAGGSWFYPIEENLQPGDSVTMVGFSGFASGGDDEAFFGYLELDPDTSVAGMIGADRAALFPL